MKYTLIRQRDNGAWEIPTPLHYAQDLEPLRKMLDMLERAAVEPSPLTTNAKREGDCLTYDRLKLKPCAMTWRILSIDALEEARGKGVTIRHLDWGND